MAEPAIWLAMYRVGINTVSLLSPLTGVGYYTLNLTRELEKMQEWSLCYFYGLFWSDRGYRNSPGDRQSLSAGSRSRTTGLRVVTRAKGIVKAVLPYSYEVLQLLQQPVFAAGARARHITLYHDPNQVPLPFDGPLVITIHDLSVLKYPETHPPARVRALSRRLPRAVERADAIIVVSEFVRQEVITTWGVDPAKVVTVYNGVGTEFRPRRQAETEPVLRHYGLTHGSYLLTVGTLEPRKNLIRLVRAYEMLPAPLRQRYPLVVVGMKGWRYAAIEREMAGWVSTGQVRLLGYLAATELPVLYAGAAVMVYPSLYEGFGLPLVEAMASGVPVITANRSSLPEVSADAGMLVEPEDEAALAEAIRALLDNQQESQRLIQRGLARARQFSWERCAQETVAVYGKALGSAGAVPA